ncbi:MAG: hypothetical protein COA86_03805 [Kangiella sp.]|nr:MAG: hypothetical protein COA86_05005 [Kangiella sp.]PHS19886.1 MAG: hypothetical protein COA86_03805 [Kangiella sp.]
MPYSYIFSWDSNKAIINERKHKVTFEIASQVFKDPNALTIFDDENSVDEERWITLGRVKPKGLLLVIHTYLEYNAEQSLIRIISARKATKRETNDYQGDLR